ncbi:TPA: TIGR04255 family protein [Pseudomonas aeruginosa]|uniref:TIGR04255 family protein n=1 Tax=Pseudomonas chaetocerotis TaxID=2758695 RepID=A0A931D4P7_9PSED|nr:TIGR04255 family protein [Pseudomonas chaetocerotis]MDN5504436.1 TIGR04255 family protein [Comamonas sp.]HBO1748433.1 TIGR04255 family protein [Pseudomonas aeruginosa]HBO7940350.1 TIGR04255 family protein [Pseudomonas aeruginosa]HBO8155338.1 TIGR04255 family protein [Pseudomonas aeruginosa]
MKIAPTPRVVYGKNPLAEVVCQIRFQHLDLPATALDQLQQSLGGRGYSQRHDESSFNVVIEPVQDGAPPVPRIVDGGSIHHFSQPGGGSKVSISREFIAFTSTDYRSWDEYLPGLLQAVTDFNHEVGTLAVTRIGLRYRDVIERSVLGLEETPWHELIKPFLLGPLANNALCEDGELDEDAFESQVSQCLMRLDGCSLLLQTSLLTSVADASKAFLIDADFFHEMDSNEECGNAASSSKELVALLETLHSNAGALFRRAITEKLHGALSPQ